jgi:glutathione S-transferase
MFVLGIIPALESSCGAHLTESAAILAFLADKHGWSDLYPTDITQRAKVNEYMHWHHNGVGNNTAILLFFFSIILSNPNITQ